MTVAEAAELMGVSKSFVRVGLQRNLLPIGNAVKMKSHWVYYISPVLFEQYTGIKMPSAATDGKETAEDDTSSAERTW